MKHGLFRIVKELLYVISGRILIYVHDSKLEIFFAKFCRKTIEICLGPIALRAVLFSEHEDEASHGTRLSIFTILDKRDEV